MKDSDLQLVKLKEKFWLTVADILSRWQDLKVMPTDYIAQDLSPKLTKIRLSTVTQADLPKIGHVDQTIWLETSKSQATLDISKVWLVRIFSHHHMPIQRPKLLARNILSVMKFQLKSDFSRKILIYTAPRISEDLVSPYFSFRLIWFLSFSRPAITLTKKRLRWLH